MVKKQKQCKHQATQIFDITLHFDAVLVIALKCSYVLRACSDEEERSSDEEFCLERYFGFTGRLPATSDYTKQLCCSWHDCCRTTKLLFWYKYLTSRSPVASETKPKNLQDIGKSFDRLVVLHQAEFTLEEPHKKIYVKRQETKVDSGRQNWA